MDGDRFMVAALLALQLIILPIIPLSPSKLPSWPNISSTPTPSLPPHFPPLIHPDPRVGQPGQTQTAHTGMSSLNDTRVPDAVGEI